MLNDSCILRAAREYLCGHSTISPSPGQRDVLLLISSPDDEIITCWASSTILSRSSALFADLTTQEHELHLEEENIQEMLLILYSLHYQWWKQPNQERIPIQVGLDVVSKHTLHHLSRKYQLMPAIIPFMAFVYKSLSSDFRRDVEALQLALTEAWQTRFQEFHRITALCVQCLRPGTEIRRLINEFIPGSLSEYYCDDYLSLVQQSWYDRSVDDITGCFRRRAMGLKMLHKCSAGVYCPLVQVVFWLVNQSYTIQKSHHGFSFCNFDV
ncbi:hypothetical protein ACJ73_02996 [Blastomyces percursus]|uniref:BTB domain-containing protein n=1 Tax=Blastomyces percursus TaxID=1658174 RepID=A0A1J9QZN9_9EURO|nr:hypothetical protein ACJ73_02996 [Blastomyces percursus]